MQTTSVLARRAARAISLLLAGALVAGCGGGRGLLPGTQGVPGEPSSSGSSTRIASAGAGAYRPERHVISIEMRMRIPRRTRGHERSLHPSTISALTNSVGIAINSAAAQFFDATPSSPGCSIGPSGTVCTFSLRAPVGTDTFTVTTYSGLDGAGTALNRGVASVPISRGKANQVAVTLGPVVSTNADSGVGSLRYAMETANNGDTIMFLLAKNTTITVLTPIQLSNTVTLAGPGVASGVTISGGGTSQIFQNVGNLTISGLTLTDGAANISSEPGGVIDSIGSLTLAGDVIGNSKSTVSIVRRRAPHPYPNRMHPHCAATFAYGGAIYNEGFLLSTGTTYTGNSVPSNIGSCISGYGGAIYNTVAGTIDSTGDTFSNNSALEGGAVYNDGLGGVTFANDTFTGNTGCNSTSGCPTTGCTSTGCTSSAQGEGAAIFDAGIGVTIVDSTFTNNVAGGATVGSKGIGGALALTTGIPTITGSVFTGNVAGGGSGSSCGTGTGGAIASSAALTINNDTFSNNVSSGDAGGGGGAIFEVGANLQGTNDTFTSNKANGYGSSSSCSASATGEGGALIAVGTASLSDSTFTNNLATGNATGVGGGVIGSQITLSGDTFAGNASVGTGNAGASAIAYGGAAAIETVGKIDASTFTSNQVVIQGSTGSEAFGGAIFSAATTSSNGNVFSGNSTAAQTSGIAGGGAIGTMSGILVSTDDTFKNNTATSPAAAGGGAVYMGGSTFLSSGSLFSGNSSTAAMDLGGAISEGGGLIEASDDVITGNSANATAGGVAIGGGLFDSNGAEILGTTISNNAASSGGGGVAAAATEEYENATISGNAATNVDHPASGGGGILGETAIGLVDSTIANNRVALVAGGSGGGAGIFDGNGLTLAQSTVSGNTLTGTGVASGGGGIFAIAAATISNSTISNNSSSLPGGGLILEASDTVALENATMFANSSAVSGGNIDNLYTVTLTNSIVGGGTAPTGPDIDNGGTLTSYDYNIIQTAIAGNPIAGTVTNTKLLTDPKLLGLANNGGPTFTNADQPTSPGVNFIPYSGGMCNATTIAADQRGYTRGADGHCDAGAFELNASPATLRHHALRHFTHSRGHWPAWVHEFHPRKVRIEFPKPAF